MTIGWIAVGLGVVGAISGKRSADRAARSTEEASEYNAKAILADGEVNAEQLKLDALIPEYKARMEADTFFLNADLIRLNAEKAKFQGRVSTEEIRMRQQFALTDASLEQEAAATDATDEIRNKNRSNEYIGDKVADIQKQAKRKKAMAQAGYAAMGVAMDSDAMNAVDDQVHTQSEMELNQLVYQQSLDNASGNKRIKSSDTRALDAKTRSERETVVFSTQASLLDLETDANVLAFENEAERSSQSGEYMDWYANFIEGATDLKARQLRTGAQLQSDQTFAAGVAQSSAQRSAGTAALIGGLGNAAAGAYGIIKP